MKSINTLAVSTLLFLSITLAFQRAHAQDAAAPTQAAAVREEAAAQEAKAETPDKAAKAEESAEDKERKRKQGLELAQMELKIQELDVQLKLAAADQAILEAEQGLAEARLALSSYESKEAPIKIDEAKIKLDRASYGAEHSEDELNELKAMYDAEEFAEMTKELVLKRAVRNLELARRGLQVSQQKLEMLMSTEIPAKMRELSQKVHKAELKLKSATMGRSKVELETRMAKTKLGHKIAELEQVK